MKLSTLLETVEDLINTISTRDHISPDEIREIINKYSVNPKYSQFVIRQWAKNNIRLPEDGPRIKETLTNFHNVKSRLPNKDLLSYKTLNDLENAIEPLIGSTSKRKGGSDILDPTKLPGVELYKQRGNYRSFKIDNVDSLKQLGEGTKWCTRGSYGDDCMADEYINDYGWIGQIWDGNKPIIQYTPDYEQVMNVNDDMITVYVNTYFKDLIIPPSVNIDINKPDFYDEEELLNILNYASNILLDRIPNFEKYIKLDANISVLYAMKVIKGRWLEAEPVIMKDPAAAVLYCKTILHSEWPEAEPYIMKDAYESYDYAKHVLHSRFPLGEEAIKTNPYYASLYASLIIEDRWPEAEPYIMTDAQAAIIYVRYIIKDRWPEAEKMLLQSRYGATYYNMVKSGHYRLRDDIIDSKK
jgi:hypothetical protein